MDPYEDQLDLNELAELMAEPPGGYNHGRAIGQGDPMREIRTQGEESGAGQGHGSEHDLDMYRELPQARRYWDKPESIVERKRPRRELDARVAASLEMTGGSDAWGYVAHAGGEFSTGLRAHRGVLNPDEWVERSELERGLEARLGCTLAEAREVYGRAGGGPLPDRLRERRARLDAVVVGIAARGGNLALLARQLGVPERNLQRAARKGVAPRLTRRVSPAPKTPAPTPNSQETSLARKTVALAQGVRAPSAP